MVTVSECVVGDGHFKNADKQRECSINLYFRVYLETSSTYCANSSGLVCVCVSVRTVSVKLLYILINLRVDISRP